MLNSIFKTKMYPITDTLKFNEFSQTWVAIFVFVITCWVNLYKDLKIFIRISSKGAFSVLALMIFIFIICFITMSNTSFRFTLLPEPFKHDRPDYLVKETSKQISLINFNPVPMAGVLAVGYFIHPCVIPVIRKSSLQKN